MVAFFWKQGHVKKVSKSGYMSAVRALARLDWMVFVGNIAIGVARRSCAHEFIIL